jgi:amino acid transporter
VTVVWRFLTGPPLGTRDVSREQITPLKGLPALSLDALTSVAYGPEAIVAVLAVAGAGALPLILPITTAIVALLAILVFSYRQVIDAYPGGGGAYAVSRANLGSRAGLVAAAALVVDYTLTVAVSIAAGVASLTSAIPGLSPATAPICLGILALVTVFNLRGLGDAARAFLLPTMAFIIGLGAIIVIGLIHPLALHAAQPGRSLLPAHVVEAVSVLLVLRAFSAGLRRPGTGDGIPGRRRIVVGVDGSAGSVAALAWTAAEARLRHAEAGRDIRLGTHGALPCAVRAVPRPARPAGGPGSRGV